MREEPMTFASIAELVEELQRRYPAKALVLTPAYPHGYDVHEAEPDAAWAVLHEQAAEADGRRK
jgi:hypothetical protein